jgi:hypothetical protein
MIPTTISTKATDTPVRFATIPAASANAAHIAAVVQSVSTCHLGFA